MEITSVLWRVFSTLGDNISTCGDNISTVGDNISTVEVAQYSGDKDLKSDRLHHRPQLLTTADMVKDLGHKNLALEIVKCRFWCKLPLLPLLWHANPIDEN